MHAYNGSLRPIYAYQLFVSKKDEYEGMISPGTYSPVDNQKSPGILILRVCMCQSVFLSLYQ